MSVDFGALLGKKISPTHQVEAALKRIYPGAPMCIDGTLSPEEEAVIRRYQQERGLPTNAAICEATYATLAADMANHPIILELAKPGESPMQTLQRLTVLNQMGMDDSTLQGFNRVVKGGATTAALEAPVDTPEMPLSSPDKDLPDKEA
jgi:hypothetical protein